MKSTSKAMKWGAMLFGLAAATGCSTWDALSSREKATVGGAAVGGVVGGAATGGGALGTVGGAAAGGLIGNQVGKERERR